MMMNQIPEGIEDNENNIYIARTSPPHVLKAYSDQFMKDFTSFLRCRSQEVVNGGMMIITVLGRKSLKLYSKQACYMWDLLAMALNDMLLQVWQYTMHPKLLLPPIHLITPALTFHILHHSVLICILFLIYKL